MKEREGNSAEAVNLYLKAGLPAKAARLAMSREVCPYVDHSYSPPTQRRIMQSFHDALHRNKLSDWSVRHSFKDGCIEQTTPSSSRPRGRYRRDLFAQYINSVPIKRSETKQSHFKSSNKL